MTSFFRIVTRLGYHLAKLPLKVVDFFAPRLYMTLYCKLLSQMGVKFAGKPRYISPGSKFDDFEKVTLGENTVISDRVVLLTHDYSLTTGLRKLGTGKATDVAFIKPITIGSNVFIGLGSILLPGSEIGKDVVIGAGSVVRGKIPENSIVLGNPAKVIAKLSDKSQTWQTEMGSSETRVD